MADDTPAHRTAFQSRSGETTVIRAEPGKTKAPAAMAREAEQTSKPPAAAAPR